MDFPARGHPERMGTACHKDPAPTGSRRGESGLAGRVVVSLCGRDRGRLYVVLEDCGRRLLLADGRGRPRSRPKRKSRKHVAVLSPRLGDAGAWDDREIRGWLRSWQTRGGPCHQGGPGDR